MDAMRDRRYPSVYLQKDKYRRSPVRWRQTERPRTPLYHQSRESLGQNVPVTTVWKRENTGKDPRQPQRTLTSHGRCPSPAHSTC